MENKKTYYGESVILYNALGFYKEVEEPDKWLNCPKCGLKPVEWLFDNGRSTACGCGKNDYDHFSIKAENIVEIMRKNNGSTAKYDSDELRKNWNKWVESNPI